MEQKLRLSGAAFTTLLILGVAALLVAASSTPIQIGIIAVVMFACLGFLLFMTKRFEKYSVVVLEIVIAAGLAVAAFSDVLAFQKPPEPPFLSIAFLTLALKIVGALYALAKAFDTAAKGVEDDLKEAEKRGNEIEIAKWQERKNLLAKFTLFEKAETNKLK
ncbi:asparagine N-glycosylation enzyme membrane subunit Stt3 [Rhizobium sp. BK512]|uniref:hypothetical protein n=1 Tax=Rhizobium sp. BK512 TaxID=2587010 RepID=UPI0013AF3236|nr:hypothetical protein [Rhizobium sp. BK512]MBB3564121.1 asparagine N-glycosylation enzyme membrane subunit Stt3 [Rhizobium sp. BK512]